jgi:hypothetical protein
VSTKVLFTFFPYRFTKMDFNLKVEEIDIEMDELDDYTEEYSQNPWDVATLQQYLHFNCPECEYKVQEESVFYAHAIKEHSLVS